MVGQHVDDGDPRARPLADNLGLQCPGAGEVPAAGAAHQDEHLERPAGRGRAVEGRADVSLKQGPPPSCLAGAGREGEGADVAGRAITPRDPSPDKA